MVFTALALGNAALILSNRSQSRSLFATLSMPNRALWWVVGGALGGLSLALYFPPLQQAFSFSALAWHDLLLCLLAASAGAVWTEIMRMFRGKKRE